MKKILFVFFFPVLLCIVNAQTAVSKKKVFEIGPGEEPVYSEYTLLLSSSGTDVSMVTTSATDKYFLYINGQKKGPFEDPKKIEWTDDREEDMYSSVYRDNRVVDQNKFLTAGDDGRMLIKANGKSYGPFQLVLNIFSDTDGNLISAITVEGMNASLLTQSGTIIKLEGIPSYTCSSPSGKKVIVMATKEFNPAAEFMNIDFSKLTQEQMMKLSKDIEAKQKAAPPPVSFLYFNDGTKLGPYPKDDISNNNPAFCKTGGDNWLMQLNSKLYVNGAEIATLENYVSNDDIWLSEDGKRYAIITNEKIAFSDGSSFDFPLKIKRITKNGVTSFTWVSLENKKDVVVYSKTL